MRAETLKLSQVINAGMECLDSVVTALYADLFLHFTISLIPRRFLLDPPDNSSDILEAYVDAKDSSWASSSSTREYTSCIALKNTFGGKGRQDS